MSQTKNKNTKNAYKSRRQLGTCFLTVRHKEKEKDCKFFAVQGGNQVLLGMPDIDNLGVLTINCETIGRQVVSADNTDSERNCQCKNAIQIEGRKFESYENKRQDAKAQANTMQTIQQSQVLLLIQQSLVIIAMKTASFQRQ